MSTNLQYDFDFLNRKNRLAGVATDLSPENASMLGAIFGNYLGGEEAVVVTARDYRKDTRMISRAFNAGLISVGTTVFELHASSLPVLQFALRRFSAHAGVHFASAHRSPEKINVRCFDQTGVEIPFSEIFSKNIIGEKPIKRAPLDKIADIHSVQQANDIYHSAIRSALKLDALKERNFSVVVDCALDPVAEIFPNILAGLGCKVLTLNAFKPEGIPESLPSPNSLTVLSRTTVAAKADLGIAFDASGSRVLFLDEYGRIVNPNIIVSILLKQKMIGRETGSVVLSNTLWTLEEWLKSQKIDVFYADDSPGEISKTIQFHRALFGANEKGNFIHPTFSNESEPFVTSLLFLWAFSQDDQSKYISTFIENNNFMNPLYITKEEYNAKCSAEVLLKKVYEADTENKIINTLNGVKIIYSKRSWVKIISSIISSRIKISACSENQDERRKMLDAAVELVKKIDEELSR